MISKEASKGCVTGFLGILYPEGVISLQYADDTLLFLELDNHVACHLKWLMVCFEQLSIMKINYDKTDTTPINLEGMKLNNQLKYFAVR
jgi:hypothetical protein